MAFQLVTILTRDFRSRLKEFDVSVWKESHPGHYKGMSVSIAPLENSIYRAAKFICDNASTDTDFWNSSLVEPALYQDKPSLSAWRVILSLTKRPLTLSLYQNRVYEIADSIQLSEARLLILEYADRERRKFERLKMKFDPNFIQMMKDPRVRIPEDVRIFVWRRDQGKCARCGSRQDMEYDHIIPVSKGGNNSARNVELLCSKCNRLKADNIK